MDFWIYIVLLVIGVIFFLIYLSNIRSNRLIEKSKKRGVISKEEFIIELEKKGFERELIDKLYDQIKFYTPTKNFTMSPDDKLVDDYGIIDEDLEEIAQIIFKERNGIGPTEVDYKIAEKNGATINTFEGILIFATGVCPSR